MKAKFASAKERLKFIATQPETICTTAGIVIGSTLTAAAIYTKISRDYDNLLTLPLGKEAFEALTNGDTNFVWFRTGKHDHTFHVTLAQ